MFIVVAILHMEKHCSIYTGLDSRNVPAFWFLNHGK